MSVSSSVPTGTYTGVGVIKLSPNNTQKSINFTVNVTKPAASDMKFNFSTKTINVTISAGTTSGSVLSFSSTGSSSFNFPGYPTSFGPGINWIISSGGIGTGYSLDQKIQVVNAPSGTYHGNPTFVDGTTGASTTFDVTVTVP